MGAMAVCGCVSRCVRSGCWDVCVDHLRLRLSSECKSLFLVGLDVSSCDGLLSVLVF